MSDAAPGAFIERHVGHLLRRAYHRARANSAEALAAVGEVSPVQASAMAALMAGPLSQAELGRRIAMQPANTHTLVRRMTAAGLVERRAGGLALTAPGAAAAARLEATLAEGAARTLAPLSTDERATLVALLRRVALP